MSYFLIYQSEDGTRIIKFDNPSKLKQGIQDLGLSKFRDTLGGDFNSWGDEEALVIEGDVIVPKPKEVVTDWDL